MKADTTSCMLHVYNYTSDYSHIITSQMWADSTGMDFEYDTALQNNTYIFNNPGEYQYAIHCNTSALGGFVLSYLNVTPTGRDPTLIQGLMYIMLLVLVGAMTYGFFVFGKNKSYENTYNQLGKLTKVDYGKSIRLLLFAISYLFFIWFIWIAYQISYAFLPVEIGITNILYVIWLIVFWSLLPLLVIWFIALVVTTMKSLITNAKIAKGYTMK